MLVVLPRHTQCKNPAPFPQAQKTFCRVNHGISTRGGWAEAGTDACPVQSSSENTHVPAMAVTGCTTTGCQQAKLQYRWLLCRSVTQPDTDGQRMEQGRSTFEKLALPLVGEAARHSRVLLEDSPGVQVTHPWSAQFLTSQSWPPSSQGLLKASSQQDTLTESYGTAPASDLPWGVLLWRWLLRGWQRARSILQPSLSPRPRASIHAEPQPNLATHHKIIESQNH